MGRLLRMLRGFAADRGGNFALITALCAVPLLGMMGLAIDYAILLSNKAKLDAAADAAAVTALVKARSVFIAGGQLSDAKTQGEAQGNAAFAVNAGTVAFAAAGNPVTASVVISDNLGQILNSQVSYSMNSTSQFGKLFQIGSYTVRGSSKSSTVLMPYYQFIFVVDVSNSMAIGGTAQDIQKLEADAYVSQIAGGTCGFACHNPTGGMNAHTGFHANDLRSYARQQGYQLKIDYVNAAVQKFITDLQNQTAGKIPGYFSVGIETYGTKAGLYQGPAYPPSLALPTAQQIDVEASNPSNNNGYTDTTGGLTTALNKLTNVGDGSAANAQATYVIFVSDGVEDKPKPGANWGRSTDITYNPSCAAIKQQGVTLVTIEATYPVVTGDAQYAALIAPLAPPNAPNMQTAMQACATDPSWAFKADDGPGIDSAVQTILQRVLQGLTRITN